MRISSAFIFDAVLICGLLFAVSAAYGLGFSGIIPAYIVAIRELYPSREASWRVPSLLFVGMGGMAFGGWFAGALYDHFGFYAPAFASGASGVGTSSVSQSSP